MMKKTEITPSERKKLADELKRINEELNVSARRANFKTPEQLKARNNWSEPIN
jgi:hypothetical protein